MHKGDVSFTTREEELAGIRPSERFHGAVPRLQKYRSVLFSKNFSDS
jgi:hypothetical protein